MLSSSKDDVTRMLSQDSYSVSLATAGVKRADGAQLASNSPCKDRFNGAHVFSLWESEKWVAATVFDGHSGWRAADHLEKQLMKTVQSRLDKLQPQSRIDEMIKKAI